MKCFYNSVLAISFSFLLSCNLTTNNAIVDRIASLDEILYHKYIGESSVNADSDFGVLTRKIEFEYEVIALDSIAQVTLMLTSGYNEGELLEGIDIILRNDKMLNLKTSKVTSREYVETYNYNTTRPTTKQQTITDPGGTDVVVQQDGTHKHVHRPTSTKTVSVTENETVNHTGSKSQIFNQTQFILLKKDLELIKQNKIDYYKLNLKKGYIFIVPNEQQTKEIYNYL